MYIMLCLGIAFVYFQMGDDWKVRWLGGRQVGGVSGLGRALTARDHTVVAHSSEQASLFYRADSGHQRLCTHLAVDALAHQRDWGTGGSVSRQPRLGKQSRRLGASAEGGRRRACLPSARPASNEHGDVRLQMAKMCHVVWST